MIVCISDFIDHIHNVFINGFVILWSKALEKLKRQLAEAEAALEARKRPPPDTGPKVVGEGLVIDEWVRTFNLYHTCSVHFYHISLFA